MSGHYDKQETADPTAPRSLEAHMYVAVASPTSIKAPRNRNELKSRPGMDLVRFEIVDVLEEPGRALSDRVLATPTLILVGERTLRCMGTLEDCDYVVDLVKRCRESSRAESSRASHSFDRTPLGGGCQIGTIILLFGNRLLACSISSGHRV